MLIFVQKHAVICRIFPHTTTYLIEAERRLALLNAGLGRVFPTKNPRHLQVLIVQSLLIVIL